MTTTTPSFATVLVAMAFTCGTATAQLVITTPDRAWPSDTTASVVLDAGDPDVPVLVLRQDASASSQNVQCVGRPGILVTRVDSWRAGGTGLRFTGLETRGDTVGTGSIFNNEALLYTARVTQSVLAPCGSFAPTDSGLFDDADPSPFLATHQLGTRFIGLELTIDGAIHYGWMEVEATETRSFVLRRVAYERTPAASVSIPTIDGPVCVADFTAPFGELTFADIAAFLGAFGAQQPAADLAAPIGAFTFADVAAYAAAFSAGCP